MSDITPMLAHPFHRVLSKLLDDPRPLPFNPEAIAKLKRDRLAGWPEDDGHE